FHVYPPGLRITHLEPVGAAAGMHLAWNPTEDGAQFLMFAEHGAPIPRTDALFPGTPILNVTASQPDSGTTPAVTSVLVGDLLASDSTGHAVRGCDLRTLNLVAEAARICAAQGCDLNQDQVSDVRDLVLMVHCVLGLSDCPVTRQALDCNDD